MLISEKEEQNYTKLYTHSATAEISCSSSFTLDLGGREEEKVWPEKQSRLSKHSNLYVAAYTSTKNYQSRHLDIFLSRQFKFIIYT